MKAPVKSTDATRTAIGKLVVPASGSGKGATVAAIEQAAVADGFSLIRQARVGVSRAELRQIGETLALTTRELASLLGMTERTLTRRLNGTEALDKGESERLLLLKNLSAHGLAVFESQANFNEWLRRPLRVLEGQSPLEMLDTATGFQVIDQVLGRIAYGVFS